MLNRRAFGRAMTAGLAAVAGALTGRAATAAPTTVQPLALTPHELEYLALRRQIHAQITRMANPVWTLDGTTPPMPPGLVEKAPAWR